MTTVSRSFPRAASTPASSKEAGSHRLGDSQPQVFKSRDREIIIYRPPFRQEECSVRKKRKKTAAEVDAETCSRISAQGRITCINPGFTPRFRVFQVRKLWVMISAHLLSVQPWTTYFTSYIIVQDPSISFQECNTPPVERLRG